MTKYSESDKKELSKLFRKLKNKTSIKVKEVSKRNN